MSRPPRRLANDCFTALDELMPHARALALLRERITPVVDSESVPLAEAHGRVLATDVIAPRDIPAFDNAAMDGFAVRHADLKPEEETTLPVSMTIFAGDVPRPLPAGTAARIFTGAPMPQGADTCVMQEDVEHDEATGLARFPAAIPRGINVRPAGEDQKTGDAVVRAGSRLRAPELAAIASTGAAKVRVYKPLRVALLSSGDEIIRPGTPFREGAIYDANHFILRGALAALPVDVRDHGIVADDRVAVEQAFAHAMEECHVIITSAGISTGEADFMAETVRKLGVLHAWRLAIKPGKPIAFGQMGDMVYLGLPGNPVAAFITFLMYGIPLLSLLAGHAWREPARYPLPAAFEMKKRKMGRREFLRGWVAADETGRAAARRFARDGSGLISSAVAASGIIELAEDVEKVEPGQPVDFIPFGEFGLPPR